MRGARNSTTSFTDFPRATRLPTRRAVSEAQGEIVLGGDVRYFAMHLPPVLTDRERLTEQFVRFVRAERSARTRGDDRVRDRILERAR
jgi:hypothetical protein